MTDNPRAFCGIAFSIWLSLGWADDGDELGTETYWIGPIGLVFAKPEHIEDGP